MEVIRRIAAVVKGQVQLCASLSLALRPVIDGNERSRWRAWVLEYSAQGNRRL